MTRRPRFVADAMLGSLARKLRIFGFDTLYFRGADEDLSSMAAGGRVALTSDKLLFANLSGRGLPAVFITGNDDKQRLLQVAKETGIQFGSTGVSRCAACNGSLKSLARSSAESQGVPPKVVARHRLFYRCTSCSRVYWRGGHWTRLRRLSSSVRTKDLTRIRRPRPTSGRRP